MRWSWSRVMMRQVWGFALAFMVALRYGVMGWGLVSGSLLLGVFLGVTGEAVCEYAVDTVEEALERVRSRRLGP